MAKREKPTTLTRRDQFAMAALQGLLAIAEAGLRFDAFSKTTKHYANCACGVPSRFNDLLPFRRP